jgi:hypothetical protein
MRRLLLGSILFSWIAFLAGVTMSGLPVGDARNALLGSMQAVLTEGPLFALTFEATRAVITATVTLTLSVILWSLMIAVTSDDNEYRERFYAVGAGIAWTLGVCAVWMVAALLNGASDAIANLFAIQAATLLAMLAAGGVEVAWEARSLASASEEEDDFGAARLITEHMATSSARLAAVGRAGRDRELT